MEKITGNETAMPATVKRKDSEVWDALPGLTIRQQFAAMAMQGLITHPITTNMQDEAKDTARFSVMLANALIAELNK